MSAEFVPVCLVHVVGLAYPLWPAGFLSCTRSFVDWESTTRCYLWAREKFAGSHHNTEHKEKSFFWGCEKKNKMFQNVWDNIQMRIFSIIELNVNSVSIIANFSLLGFGGEY